MHRARHTAQSPAFRPRLLIALLVAGVGLTFALWLPTRNDSASATENGRPAGHSQNDSASATANGRRPAGRSQGDHRRDRDHDWDHDGNHDRDHRRDRRREWPPVAPSPSESAAAPSPSKSAPSETPTSEAPRATQWAPFTNYVAGQLVTFKGVEYQVQQAHTALPGWEPSVLPALFKPLD
jgi:hypothetical protein